MAHRHTTVNLFKQEIKSDYSYPQKYQPKSIFEQVEILREIFPDINPVNEHVIKDILPEHAEGQFAIPRWQTIASTFSTAVLKIMQLLAVRRAVSFARYDAKSKIAKDASEEIQRCHFTQDAHTIKCLQIIESQQSGQDILVIPAQFGLRYKGFGRCILEDTLFNEFALDSYTVGCMLLTHPERLNTQRNFEKEMGVPTHEAVYKLMFNPNLDLLYNNELGIRTVGDTTTIDTSHAKHLTCFQHYLNDVCVLLDPYINAGFAEAGFPTGFVCK